MKRWMLCLAPLAVLATLVVSSTASTRLPNSTDVIKASATADKPDAAGKQTVTITLEIQKSYHIYANPVGLKDLQDTQTVVTLKGGATPIKVTVDYPPGKLTKDDVVGDYKIYEGTVTIKATVVRAKDDTAPLTAEVAVQACNDRICLMPGTIKVPVK